MADRAANEYSRSRRAEDDENEYAVSSSPLLRHRCVSVSSRGSRLSPNMLALRGVLLITRSNHSLFAAIGKRVLGLRLEDDEEVPEDDKVKIVDEIESLCMNCEENVRWCQ